MDNIFITSDTHFCHDKPFIYQPRGYQSVEEMNKDLIQKWNSVVSFGDTVYHLGDVMLGDLDAGISCLRQLNGNIFIIRGNHDTDRRAEAYLFRTINVIDVKYADVIKKGHWGFYLSHYPTLCSNYDDEKKRHGIISLCGHTHTTDPFADFDKGLIYHCEVDAHDGFPVPIEQIICDIKERLSL